jgi:hypothetical protein
MGFQDYIGESEACAFAGVSASTLRRFAEAGYFQIETDSDGLRLFSKSEIENLFGLKPAASNRPKPSSSPFTPPQSASSPSPHVPLAATPEKTQELERTAPLTAAQPNAHESSPSTKTAATVVRAPITEEPRIAVERTSEIPASPRQSDAGGMETRGEAIEALEREVTKLQNILALQEKLLDIREEEIKSIKGERDWLRSRIEKLEEKNERDQLLLLAETQTVRQLINLQQRKRSTVQLALEWLGLKSAPPAPGQPIDISPSTPAVRATEESR